MLGLFAVCVVFGLPGPVQAQGRYSYSTAGSEVTDSRTGLVWQRCSAGLAWSGETCTGSVFSSPHEDALVFARLQSGWRLPNVKELASLIDLGFENPAIDTIAFPGTPAGCHWTSTPVVGVSGAWQVSFFDGLVQGLYRSGYCFARLVR